MWTHFIFKNGSNPYIAKTEKRLFEMLKKYDCENIGENTFFVIQERQKPVSGYNAIKEMIRDFAIEWQLNFTEYQYSYYELAFYGDFFGTYGKRYGLMKEFHANGII